MRHPQPPPRPVRAREREREKGLGEWGEDVRPHGCRRCSCKRSSYSTAGTNPSREPTPQTRVAAAPSRRLRPLSAPTHPPRSSTSIKAGCIRRTASQPAVTTSLLARALRPSQRATSSHHAAVETRARAPRPPMAPHHTPPRPTRPWYIVATLRRRCYRPPLSPCCLAQLPDGL